MKVSKSRTWSSEMPILPFTDFTLSRPTSRSMPRVLLRAEKEQSRGRQMYTATPAKRRAMRTSAVVGFMAVPQGSESGYSMRHLGLQVSSDCLTGLPDMQGGAMDTLVAGFLIFPSFGAPAGGAR